jgi:hypothetical protein
VTSHNVWSHHCGPLCKLPTVIMLTFRNLTYAYTYTYADTCTHTSMPHVTLMSHTQSSLTSQCLTSHISRLSVSDVSCLMSHVKVSPVSHLTSVSVSCLTCHISRLSMSRPCRHNCTDMHILELATCCISGRHAHKNKHTGHVGIIIDTCIMS